LENGAKTSRTNLRLTVYTLRGGEVKRYFPDFAIFSHFFSFQPARPAKFAAFLKNGRNGVFLRNLGWTRRAFFGILATLRRNGAAVSFRRSRRRRVRRENGRYFRESGEWGAALKLKKKRY